MEADEGVGLRQHRTIRLRRLLENLRSDFVFLKYTKYSCKKMPSSEPKFSQDSLSPNYAVLP